MWKEGASAKPKSMLIMWTVRKCSLKSHSSLNLKSPVRYYAGIAWSSLKEQCQCNHGCFFLFFFPAVLQDLCVKTANMTVMTAGDFENARPILDDQHPVAYSSPGCGETRAVQAECLEWFFSPATSSKCDTGIMLGCWTISILSIHPIPMHTSHLL